MEGTHSQSIRFLIVIIIMMMSFLVSMSSFAPEKCPGDNPQKGYLIGAIIDSSSRAGREQKIGMKIARDDFCSSRNFGIECPALLINDFRGSSLDHDPIGTASLASSMIKDNGVKAILFGLESWHKALIVAKIANKSQVPIFSLANDHIPNWGFQYLPYLLNAAPSQRAQMKAVAAIIRTWQWQRANVIYEDIESIVTGVTPYLIHALHEVGSEINTLLPVPPNLGLSHQNMTSHLHTLKDNLCRVYIVHTDSPTRAIEIFKAAKRLGLMEEDSVWITTTLFTNHFDSLGLSDIEAMQGVVGVRSYFPKTGKRYNNFRSKFMARYALDYPHEPNLEPGILAFQAYDATFVFSLKLDNPKPFLGKEILKNILKIKYDGFFGHFNFNHSALPPACIFEIVNVVGRSYDNLGFWTERLGFSKKTHGQLGSYNESMRILGQVVWPGRPWTIPRGWASVGSGRRLRIAVPSRTTFSEFVNVKYDANGTPIIKGFSIEVFKRVVGLLEYNLTYDFHIVNASSYDFMMEQVHLEHFDGVVADTAIVANRCSYVQFSQPYAESGVQMVIYYEALKLQKALLFLAPFTGHLWLATFFINIYNGLAIYWVEQQQNIEFNEGSIWNRIGFLLASAFNTLFSLQGPMLKRNSTRLAFVIWLFVCVVLIQTYTASLTTLLTDHNRPPTMIDIQTLKRTGAKVGCDANSFVVKYLEEALGFKSENIVKIHSGDEYPDALETGRINAAFLEVPYVKLFTAKHCKNFVLSGQPFNVGGFGFAFSKNSRYLPDISQAILTATEKGTLLELERTMYSSYSCSSVSTIDGETTKIGLSSFYVPFIVTGAATSFALLKHIIRRKQKGNDRDRISDRPPVIELSDVDNQAADHNNLQNHHHGSDHDRKLSFGQQDHEVIHINCEPSPTE